MNGEAKQKIAATDWFADNSDVQLELDAGSNGSRAWLVAVLLGVVFHVQSLSAVVWAAICFAIVTGATRLSTDRDAMARLAQFKYARFVPPVAAFVSSVGITSFLVVLGIQSDFTTQLATTFLLAGIAVVVATWTSPNKWADLTSLLVCCCALLIAPAVNAILDPERQIGAQLFVGFAAFLFILELLRTHFLRRHSKASFVSTIEEVRRQEALSRMMFEQASVVVYLLDTSLRCVRVNTGFYKSHSKENPIGRPVFDFLSTPNGGFAQQLEASLNGASISIDAMRMQLSDGSTRYFDIETSPWLDANGEVTGVVCHIWAADDRVQAEAEAARRAECLDIALQASGACVWEYNVTTKSARWYGDPEKVFGSQPNHRDLAGLSSRLFHVDDLELVQGAATALSTVGHADYTVRVNTPDGGVGWIQVWAKAVTDHGQRRLIFNIINITERKLEEANLLDALGRAKHSLVAKRSLLADLAQESGVDEGLNLSGLCSEEIEQAQDAAGIGIREIVSRFNDLLLEVEVRDDALGEAVRSLRKAREASESANLAKSQFLANMSHELRTPLNAIIGYSEILAEDAVDDGREADARDLERVLAAARSLLTLINEILDLSKIEAGRMDVAIGDYDIHSLIDNAVSTVKLLAEKNGNKLSVQFDDRLEVGRSDAFKLNQCLLNLLSNASKFTKDGTIVVDVTLHKIGSNDWMKVSVSDTGIGMSDEQVARLFQPFVQADASTTREYGGTGLGLVITRRMMQLLGGDISVRSVKGEGSVFTLNLPLNYDLRDVDHDHESFEMASEGQGPLVLVIDDEEDVAELVQRSIGRLGFRVISAPTAEAGLRVLAKKKPALILLDINLPDRSGWSVLEEFSKSGLVSQIPTIVHSIHDDQARAAALGACAHFVKPVDRDVLAAAVARFARADGDENAARAGVVAVPSQKATA